MWHQIWICKCGCLKAILAGTQLNVLFIFALLHWIIEILDPKDTINIAPFLILHIRKYTKEISLATNEMYNDGTRWYITENTLQWAFH